MAKKTSRTERDLNRVTLHRIHRIFERIRSGDFPNKRVLAEELSVTQKTIQRDLDFMRDTMELPIEYDARRYGFRFSKVVESFPLLKLTEGELFAIFVGEKALESYVGTPFEAPLRAAFRKFTAGLSGELSVQWSELKGAISFKGIEVQSVPPEILQELTLAIRQRREAAFDYRGLNQKEFGARRVCPYELVLVDHQWYLFAFDLDRQALRRFVPGRLRNLRVSTKTFVKPKGFSAAEHLKNSFGIYSGAEAKRVIIVFDHFASQLVRERRWHPSQETRDLAGGRVELTLTLGSFEEVERWILSWGHHAVLAAPAEWVERLKQTLTQSRANY